MVVGDLVWKETQSQKPHAEQVFFFPIFHHTALNMPVNNADRFIFLKKDVQKGGEGRREALPPPPEAADIQYSGITMITISRLLLQMFVPWLWLI